MGRENGPAPSPSAVGKVGEIELRDHRSFNGGALPNSMDSFSGPSISFQTQGLHLYGQEWDYSSKRGDRAISPKTKFRNESLQFTRGWLPSSQPNWKIDPSSFEYPLPSRQQVPTSLFLNRPACEPNQPLHCDSGYETWDEPPHSLSQRHQSSESEIMPSSSQMLSGKGTGFARTNTEMFRFHTCLQASTAMVNESEEAPESYLNKGQVYNLRVLDTAPPGSVHETIRYRTIIRVSFKEEEQRLNAEAYWQLWKDSRGLAESDMQDSELRAVECVSQVGQSGHRVQIEEEFLDGFSVTWAINPATGPNECTIPVRFNFLSTDFTLAKGVKGISVRLCAKSNQLSNIKTPYQPEICFCNIRVFRDHGAERKLSNDMTNVQKRIQKLTEQVTSAAHHEPPKKRKRGSVVAKSVSETKGSDQTLSHEQRWSTDSNYDQAADPSPDKLQEKLINLQNMLFSSCPESVLNLRGGKEDDPEVHITRQQEPSPGAATQRISPSRNSMVSRNNSLSSVGPGLHKLDTSQNGFPVDLKRSPMPVASFYIHHSKEESSSDQYYRTIYLGERTADDLTQRICEKCGVDASSISCILHTSQSGLEILVDDDFVQQMTEGQDMIVKIEKLTLKVDGVVSTPSAPLRIWLEY